MTIEIKLYKTGFLAVALFVFGFALSVIAPGFLAWGFMYFSIGLAIISSVLTLLLPQNAFSATFKMPLVKFCIPIILVQSIVFILTFVFFYTWEHQTRINPRLQALEPGRLLEVLKAHIFTLGVFPWMLYAGLGVIFAYFSFKYNRTPSFSAVILPEHQKHPKLFFYHYISVATHAVIMFPILFMVSLSLIWLCEGICAQFNWPSLFQFPFRSIFICALMLIGGQKFNTKFFNWAKKKQIPLGGILVLYVVSISFFMIWMHGFSIWFFSGYEYLDRSQFFKSGLASALTTEQEETRLALLIWGWWGVWIPWMTSFIARMCFYFGRSPWQALIICMIFPLFIFYSLVHVPNGTWQIFFHYFQFPGTQMIIALTLLLFMMMMWGSVQNTADLERGAMLQRGQWHKRPLAKWMPVFIINFNCFFVALFMVGWLPVQVIGTLGAGYMTTIVMAFILMSINEYRLRRKQPKERPEKEVIHI